MKKLFLALTVVTFLSSPAFAIDDGKKSDDRVAFTIASEDWVAAKTARVTVGVEAAVSDATAGGARADMIKAINGLAKAEWRLVNFFRNQDQTGLERWSAQFETRLPETDLSGLSDRAKKTSKAGMQISVQGVDFSPTLAETESVKASLRADIYKKAGEQLAQLNTALPGRGYRIALIEFNPESAPQNFMRQMPMMAKAMMGGDSAAENAGQMPMERSEKVMLNARVEFAATAK